MALHHLPAAPLLPVLIGLALLTWATDTPAQIRRCIAPDGTHVFTDRPCGELDSAPRHPGTNGSARRASNLRPRCMRSIDALVFEMARAFDSRDTNRLAGLYHWTGMSSGRGYATFERLDRLIQNPLVGIVPVMPDTPRLARIEQPPTPDAHVPQATTRRPPAWETWPWARARNPATLETAPPAAGDDSGAPPAEPAAKPMPGQRRHPVALRVEQSRSDGVSGTVFGLTRHFGCWWIRG